MELYVHDLQPKIDKPVRELKGFQKVELQPGQTKAVTLMLAPRALAYCDVPGKQWKADAGNYEIEVGASSRDIRQRARLRLGADSTEAIPFMQTPVVQTGKDLAVGHPVTASSVQLDNRPENTVDNDETTRWSTDFSDPQWIAVDLGKPFTINRVRLLWETAYATAYAIQVSMDGKTWTDVYSTQKGQGGEENIKFAPVPARWVRMYGTQRATQYGYSLFSFEVYAP